MARNYRRRWKIRRGNRGTVPLRFRRTLGYTRIGGPRVRNGPYSLVPRLSQNTVYSFKRMTQTTSINPGAAGVNAYGAFYYRLVDVPGYTEFTTLFDQYRMTGVKMKFVPRASQNVSTQSMGDLVYIIDYDDATAPTSQNQLLENQSVKVRQVFSRPFSVYIRPRTNFTVIGTSGNQTANIPIKTWLDCASPDANYFGLKWAWVNAASTLSPLPSIDIYITYYVQFRGVQ